MSSIKAEGKDEINGAQGHDKDNANSWLNKLKEEALRRGVKKEVIERAFDGVILSERILEIAQNCPEVKLTAEEYLKRGLHLGASLTGALCCGCILLFSIQPTLRFSE
eukprot:Gb_18087 [translate_table: standard]